MLIIANGNSEGSSPSLLSQLLAPLSIAADRKLHAVTTAAEKKMHVLFLTLGLFDLIKQGRCSEQVQ